MAPTKYDFMQDMLTRARNKHRKELGLCPEQPEAAQRTPGPIKATDGQAGGFDGKLANPMPLVKWFGKGCRYQCCQWEENEETGGPDYKEAHPVLIFCNHKQNKDNCEGNCNERLCPLETPANSTGIGGDCPRCGVEDVRL